MPNIGKKRHFCLSFCLLEEGLCMRPKNDFTKTKNMISKGYLWTIRIVTLLSLVALTFIVVRVDPQKDPSAKIFFYSALFFFLSGMVNLLLLRLRRRRMRGELVYENIVLSLRQGILLAFLAIGLFLLQGFRMLLWWDGLLLLAGIFLIELYFLSRED